MITTEREVQNTTAALRRFEEALGELERGACDNDPQFRDVLRESYKSEIAVLRGQLAEYRALRRGEVRTYEADSLDGIADALVCARLASGLSQRELAERVGLEEERLCYFEANRYYGATLQHVLAIADALGLAVNLRYDLSVASRTSTRAE